MGYRLHLDIGLLVLTEFAGNDTRCPATEETLVADQPFRTNCSLGYSGLWAPEITWVDSDGNAIPGTNDTTSDLANYWAEFTPTAEDDGKALTCTATMPPPPDGVLPDDDLETVHSRNAPDYNGQSCVVTIDVQCKYGAICDIYLTYICIAYVFICMELK